MQIPKLKPGDQVLYVARSQGAAERRAPMPPAPIVEYVWPAIVVRVHMGGAIDAYVTPNSADVHGKIPPGFDISKLLPDVPGRVGGEGWRLPVAATVGGESAGPVRVQLITRYATAKGSIVEAVASATVIRMNTDGSADLAVTPADADPFNASNVLAEPADVSSILADDVMKAGYKFRQSFRRVA